MLKKVDDGETPTKKESITTATLVLYPAGSRCTQPNLSYLSNPSGPSPIAFLPHGQIQSRDFVVTGPRVGRRFAYLQAQQTAPRAKSWLAKANGE